MASCWACGWPATKKCGRCLEVDYCSRSCQLADWDVMHRRECNKVTTPKTAESRHKRSPNPEETRDEDPAHGRLFRAGMDDWAVCIPQGMEFWPRSMSG
ncbi:MYND zinc finger containing [Mollivirus sibericum]|uniref:MYND zinc finger containing n=1 Tax=Mollivirus sibericum TaxID=1678078 RepID=UPI0006B2ED39|nr:MYND zinc finger containing [Mollivirus sibericum]ALD62127.1 MYND zinc finger containing [Mollivirus sibericum]